MHQKVFLVDSDCAAVGTANLDNRSFRLNFELTLPGFNRTFIDNVETVLGQDFSQSRLVALEDCSSRWFPFKAAARLDSLLSPVMERKDEA